MATASTSELMRRDGFVHLPAAVSRPRIERALRRIHAWMGRGMPPDQMSTFGQRTSCPEERDHDDFLDLWRASSLPQAVEGLMGPGSVAPVQNAQIALRYPSLEDDLPPPQPHLDGISAPDNGVAPGTLHNFAALAGIYLQDVSQPWSGNFTVWPGSHLRHAAHFRLHGPEALLQGMPEVELGPPRQLMGKAGDAFVCHYLVGHGHAANRSHQIRYAVFFRLYHVQHRELGRRPMTDPWLGWEGLTPMPKR